MSKLLLPFKLTVTNKTFKIYNFKRGELQRLATTKNKLLNSP